MTIAIYTYSPSMQDYIKYLKNVLGVSQILKDESASATMTVAPSQAVISAHRIAVWVENYNQFSSEDLTLLNNMLAAMKIPDGDMVVCDLVEKNTSAVINFDLVLNPDSSGSQTYSPQVLHANKNLKSTVWTFLQTIMQKYKFLN